MLVAIICSNKQVQKYNMQSQPQQTQQSHTSQPIPQSQPTQPHIEIDTKLLKTKQQLLQKYLSLPSNSADTQRLQLIRNWPNTDIQQAIQNTQYVTKTNNAWYFGMACNQMFHGYGLLIYENAGDRGDRGEGGGMGMGRFYQGEFQNNCKHGYGFQYINGDIYVGKFINNKPEDPNGIFLWQNGDLYMGSFVNGMKHGHGRWESSSDFYEGTWKLNRPEGSGKIHTNASEYQGDVKNGYKHGRGIEIFSNGDRYDGLYANGKPEGDGVYSWKNGAIYKGQFKNGIRYGYGSWSYGSESYVGDYINDKRNGQGVYKWGGNSYYEGEFMDDLRHGRGEMHWNQNSFYRGQWRQGLQSGQGEIWEDGNLVSKGLFEEGKFVQEPNKLQRSSATERSNPNSHSNLKKTPNPLRKSHQKPSTRYPAISQPRAHSHSKHNNLSQIDEFPKVQTKTAHKKYIASTSFSNHTKNSGYSSITNQSFEQRHRQTVKIGQFDDGEERKHQFIKRREHQNQKMNFQGTGLKFPSSKDKKVHVNSKRTLYEKKKIQIASKTASKSSSVVDMGDTQLGPIRWKNFTHMKNNPGDTSYNKI